MNVIDGFGGWLRAELLQRDLTYADFARRIGVSAATVSRWASGKFLPDLVTVGKIAGALELPPAVVLARSGHRDVSDDEERSLIDVVERLEDLLIEKQRELRESQEEFERLASQHRDAGADLAEYYRRRSRLRRQETLEGLARDVVDHLVRAGHLSRSSADIQESVDIARRILNEAYERGDPI